jgi:hypothetical protein
MSNIRGFASLGPRGEETNYRSRKREACYCWVARDDLHVKRYRVHIRQHATWAQCSDAAVYSKSHARRYVEYVIN